ncbi:winged helix-turn-helix transcriptional regulator [Haloarcula montana]|uniref:winged helix-turn-helix transcriptional regulator n=1 Tax=Haloarcula montana TaxID=3111776 RepID=UPI002D774E82|nr:helix-turn-helix domain-containing protein [Haloarcula sp. GH36]
MTRSTVALAVGLVCCVLLASGLGAAVTTDERAVPSGLVADDGVVPSDNDTSTVGETTDSTTSSVDETTDDAAETDDNTTSTVSTTTETTTSTVPKTAENTTGSVEETTENAADTTRTVRDDAESASESAGSTLDGASNTTVNATARPSVNATADGAVNVDGTSARGATPDQTGTTARTNADGTAAGGANRSTANASSTAANASAGAASGAKPPGLGGEMPTPDGKSVAVGVGATVAAGAAGRAYVGATGGSPTAASGVAQSSVPFVRTAYRGVADRLWRFLGIAGYALHSEDPLEHETRADLAAAIEDNPGAYLSELADASDASMSTVRYHLKVLEREAVVTPVKIRGKRRYFSGDEPTDKLAAALADDATETVLRALATVGPASVSALADELDRDPSTVTHHLDRLQESGLVERERDGRAVVNSLAPTAAAAMAPRVGERGDSPAVGSSPGD